jgi:tetratricopeptide (TPR) repeat protein
VKYIVEYDETRGFRRKEGTFIQRIRILDDMHAKISGCRDSVKKYGLYGLTGCGKTELAICYTRTYHNKYTACFRVDGKSEIEFETGMAGLAGRIFGLVENPGTSNVDVTTPGQGDASVVRRANFQRVVQWLNQAPNSAWLLVIDDIVFDKVASRDTSDEQNGTLPPFLKDYLGKLRHGTVIFTTQSNEISQIFPSSPVDELKVGEALNLGQEILGQDFEAVEIKKLVRILALHAQSIDCAANYIRQQVPKITIARYIQLWTECERNATFPEVPSLGRSLSVTLNITFEKLSQGSQELLERCVCFNPLHISMELLTSSAEQQTEEEGKTQRVVGELAKLCLVQSNNVMRNGLQERAISIHPAVYKFAELRLTSENAGAVIEQRYLYSVKEAVKNIGQSLPQRRERTYAATIQRLSLHVERCRMHLKEFSELEWEPNVLWNISNMAKILCEVRSFQAAKRLYKIAKRGYERLEYFGPDYLRVLHDWGVLHLCEDHPERAIKYFDEVEEQARRHGNGIPDRLELHRGVALRDLGALKPAEALFEKCLRSLQEAGNPEEDRLSIVQIKQSLGKLKQKQGDLGGAATMILSAIHTLKTGSFHLPFAHQNLAAVYSQDEDFAEARAEYQIASDQLKLIYGADSVQFLENGWLIVQTYEMQYKRTEQDPESSRKTLEVWFEKSSNLWSDQRQHLGCSHENTLRTASMHADAYLSLDRVGEAVRDLRKVKDLYEKKRKDTKDTEGYHRALYLLAKCLIDQAEDEAEVSNKRAKGKAEEAFQLLETCTEHARKTKQLFGYLQFERVKAIRICGTKDQNVEELETLIGCGDCDELLIGAAESQLAELQLGK